jgi:hypothetical protein
VARSFGHPALNPAADGLGDHLALPREPSSEVNQELGSVSRFDTSLAGDTYRSHAEASCVAVLDSLGFPCEQLHVCPIRPD